MQSTAACFAAVALVAYAAPGPVVATGGPADAAAAASASRCDPAPGARGKPCDEDARRPRGSGDEARVYADARSTRLRNQAYLRAAAAYCERYSGRVRAACVDEAAAIYRP